MDPFFAEKTMAIFCDILEPTTGERYERDPRGTARKAEAYLQSTGIGDKVFFGPEAEFFIFDDVRFKADPYNCGFVLDSSELPTNMDTEYETGNLGHRMRTKGGYFPVPPQDSCQDIRSEMLTTMAAMGVATEKHHHEVAAAQHELGVKFGPMTRMADNMQIYKYVVHMVANNYGKTATFMPKPVFGDNGSGMHCHQSIWKGDTPVFAGNLYADLSETCLFYIGGILKHARPSTPSPTRPRTPTSVSCRAMRRRCCAPIPRATARPPAASRMCRARRRNASRCASPTRRPTPISPSPPC
jgi:glutamine synthetase